MYCCHILEDCFRNAVSLIKCLRYSVIGYNSLLFTQMQWYSNYYTTDDCSLYFSMRTHLYINSTCTCSIEVLIFFVAETIDRIHSFSECSNFVHNVVLNFGVICVCSSPGRSPGFDHSETMLMNNVYRDRFPKVRSVIEKTHWKVEYQYR